MSTGSTVMRIVETLNGGWDIREPGNPRPLDHCADMDEAVRKAGSMMLHGGAVRIVNREGFLVETRTVPAPGNNPWWYVAPRPLFWVFGVGFTLQGVLQALFGQRGGFFFWGYLVMSLLGITYIVFLLISLRRDRHLSRPLD